MLNISNIDISERIEGDKYKTIREVEGKSSKKTFIRFLYIISIVSLILLFLPWTQNIRTNGNVTTLKPSQRPQTINSVIPGKIEKWFVQEGDIVHIGDTLLILSEVKGKIEYENLVEGLTYIVETDEQTGYQQKITKDTNYFFYLFSFIFRILFFLRK